MEIIDSYKNWLRSKSYSDATVRNYLVDLRKYFEFSSLSSQVRVDPCVDHSIIFDSDNLTAYIQNINQDQNYKRFLASLSKFFQFATDQHFVSENPFPKSLKNTSEPVCPPIEQIINTYKKQLETKHFSISTIRNYINDIQQYINWIKSTPTPPLTKEGAINNIDSHFELK